VVATANQGQTMLTVDRKLPLITIKAVAMSTLRDDWFVRRKSKLGMSVT
jgi:myosin-1